MLKYLAVLALVLAVASQGIPARAASSKTNPSLVKVEKAGGPQNAGATDPDSPIAGQDSGPTFIYNTQKEQQKDKWDKAAVISHFVLAGVGAIGLVLAFLILNILKRQSEVLEQTVILQHRPRLHIRRLVLDLELKEIAFTVANAGGTRAFVRDGKFLAKQMGSEAVGLSLFEEAESIGEFYLKPGEEKSCSIAIDETTARAIGEATARGIGPASESASLVFAGVLWYRDNLGIERSVGVHRVLDRNGFFFSVVAGTDAEYSD
jgi:hypothetical protein